MHRKRVVVAPPLVLAEVLFLSIASLLLNIPLAFGQVNPPAEVSPLTPADQAPPAVSDPNLRVDTIATGLKRPVAMAFLGNSSDDILVVEKDNGTVRRIIEGVVQPEPLVDVAVANDNNTNERGLLGMAVAPQNGTTTYVFLYYTESGGGQDGDDAQGIVPVGNRLYRYELAQEPLTGSAKLINPKLLLDLPARPGPRYNGGPLLVSQNQTNNETIVYLIIGDLDHHETQSQNNEDGPPPDGTSGILAVDADGNPLPNPVLVGPVIGGSNDNEDEDEDDEDDEDNEDGETSEDIGMLSYYYAYGIRNSFGMDFDPVAGYIWDTENGRNDNDEINLVLPGFNSGWPDIQGPASRPENEGADIEEDLVDFGGRGEYRDPEFTWSTTVGPTAIKFYNSIHLGAGYQNDIFVGDINNGRLYHFDLNEDRTGLMLGDGSLADKVADNEGELASGGVVFGTGFRSISDIEVGPDGNLYLLMYGPGKIMRIAPDAQQ
ncbi:MAG: PQQ-dependent sugar dehydrogenase [Thermoproteota archaeon]|nr:PQQ-dependent sugar dehydrogenase [Thermoproteota archaeon]